MLLTFLWLSRCVCAWSHVKMLTMRVCGTDFQCRRPKRGLAMVFHWGRAGGEQSRGSEEGGVESLRLAVELGWVVARGWWCGPFW